MTVGEREILFAAENKDTDRLIGRVLAGELQLKTIFFLKINYF